MAQEVRVVKGHSHLVCRPRRCPALHRCRCPVAQGAQGAQGARVDVAYPPPNHQEGRRRQGLRRVAQEVQEAQEARVGAGCARHLQRRYLGHLDRCAAVQEGQEGQVARED